MPHIDETLLIRTQRRPPRAEAHVTAGVCPGGHRPVLSRVFLGGKDRGPCGSSPGASADLSIFQAANDPLALPCDREPQTSSADRLVSPGAHPFRYMLRPARPRCHALILTGVVPASALRRSRSVSTNTTGRPSSEETCAGVRSSRNRSPGTSRV